MTISRRLLLLVGASILGLLLVGGGGLWHISSLNRQILTLTDNLLPSLETIYSLDADFYRLRTHVLQHTLQTDKDRIAALDNDVAEARKTLESLIDRYRNYISDEEDRRLLGIVEQALASYYGVVERVLKQSRAGDKETARQIAATDGAQAALAVRNALQAHLAHNNQLTDVEQKRAHASITASRLQTSVITVLALIGISALGYALRRRIVHALHEMQQTVNHIALHLDFSRRIAVHGNDEISLTLNDVNRLIETLQTNFRQIRERSEEVRSASGTLAQTAGSLSGSAREQSEAASNMAATVEEVTVSIQHVSDRAREASALSETSGQTADTGAQVIRETVDEINQIATTVSQSAERIGLLREQGNSISAVVQVIRDIADQTNLLALNAAIEAARAGEQGRGFAVVADEVRKLAERTAQSTQEITGIIQALQSGTENAVADMNRVVQQVEGGVQRANEASGAIDAIRDSASAAVQMVSEITDAIQEQSVAMTNIAQQVERIAQMVEENSASANGAAQSAQRMDGVANNLQQIVANYRL